MEQIIWAVDPFEKDLKLEPEFVHHLKEWLSHSGLEIQPVYVLSSPREEQMMASVAGHREFLEEAVSRHFQDIGLRHTRLVQILFDGEASRQNATKKLVDFSLRLWASGIIVGSRGRSGVQRMIFGSFAENLLAQSPLPVFFLTHQRKEGPRPAPLVRALFATDFSEQSRSAYEHFLKIAQRFKFEVFLFHSVAVPGVAALGTGFAAGVPETFLVDLEKAGKDQGEQWIAQAEEAGLRAHLIVQNVGFDTRVGAHILRVARQQDIGLIAMASVSGSWESAVMGSVAREVCRANQFPVWAYGPKAFTEEASSRLGASPETHLEV